MELMRRAIRSVLGYNSMFYQYAAKFVGFIYTVSKDGMKTWSVLNELRDRKRTNEPPRSVVLKNLVHPILLRPGTIDANTVLNNVIREEYGHFRLKRAPQWMIDAGAYIGDTAAYYLSKFPELKVIALEPNPESYEMARNNLEPYGERSFLINKGLYSNDELQNFSGSSTGASIAASGIEIECATISSLFKEYSIPFLDILKMDIEGAEEAVFSSKPELWLGQVGLLMIEIHNLRTESLISCVLNENGFKMKRYRSIWYCWPKNR